MAAAEVVLALVAAARALATGERERALDELLVAWRVVRHPRLANLIDFVSDQLLAGQPPIKGKTLAARMVAWHELEAKRDPATLARLLATPWPGTWQKAVPVVEPLLGWPDDPRFAPAMVAIVEEWPFDVWRASKFYYPVFDLIDRQRDLRVLARLRRQLEVNRIDAYQQSVRARLVGAIALLEQAFPGDAPTPLDSEIEAAIANVEAHFRERIDSIAEHREAQVDHLAAIYADPEDDAARAVYADLLGERGDPRGELITLQLARARGEGSEQARARERKLIEEHGKQWAGTLDLYFDRYVFERGFFAGGALRWRGARELGRTLDEIVADPAWSLVRVLESRSDASLLLQLVDRPELRSLRAVRTSYERALELAGGPERRLTGLFYETGYSEPIVAPLASPLATCASLPALRELGFYSRHVDAHVAWIRSAPVVERLTRLVISELQPRYYEATAARAGTLRELEVLLYGRREGWKITLHRDRAPGLFTRLVLTPHGGPHKVEGLARILRSIPAEWLRELVISTPKKLDLPAAERAELGDAIRRFTQLEHRELPWPELDETPAPAPAPAAPPGPTLVLRVDGETLLAPEKIDGVWRALGELGLQFDSFTIGSKWRSLGADPVARLRKWAGNARCYDITVYRDGAPDRLLLGRSRWPDSTSATLLEVVLGERTYDEIIAWFVRFLDLGVFESGSAHLAGTERRDDAFDLRQLGVYSTGWLVYFGPAHTSLLPRAKVAALGLVAHKTAAGVVIALAPRPEELTRERAVAAAAGLRGLLVTELVARFGYRLEDRVRELVGPTLAELGFVHVPDEALPFGVRFATADGKRVVVVHIDNAVAKPQVTAHFHEPPAFHRLIAASPAATRDEIDAALVEVARTLLERAR